MNDERCTAVALGLRCEQGRGHAGLHKNWEHGQYRQWPDGWGQRWGFWEARVVHRVVPGDGDPTPDVGPDPVVLPASYPNPCGVVIGQQKGVGQGLFISCENERPCAEHGMPAPVVLPRPAACNNWERWTEDE